MPRHYVPKHGHSDDGIPDLQGAAVPGGVMPVPVQRRRKPQKAKGPSHMVVVTPTPYEDPDSGHRLNVTRIIGFVLLGVAVVLLAVAAGLFADAFVRYADQDRVNEELSRYVTVTDDPSEAPTVDWGALKAVDPNVCAWIQIPGTVINYPVYQGTDNEYYLDTTAYGEYGIGGQIFLDCENTNPGLVDEQTIIYGHHLQNGSMFAYLAEFDSQTVFDDHTTVWYVTEQQSYELEPLLCYRTVGTDVDVRTFQWPTVDEFHGYLDSLLAKAQASRKDASTIIDGTQHVLTLSTCSYEEENGRTILVCVPKGEASAARLAA